MNRHLIYTNGRSGSNALASQLKQHPNLVNYGEVLGPWTTPGKRLKPLFRGPDAAARYLDFILGSHTAFTTVQGLSYLNRKRTGRPTQFRRWRDTTSLGIKEFAVNFHRNGLEHYLSTRADLRLIVLLRENPVQRFVSVQRLRQTGVAALGPSTARVTHNPVTIDLAEVVADLDRYERENELLRIAACEHRGPTMVIRYEDYFSRDPDGQDELSREIQAFLGVRPMRLRITHRRMRQGRLADAVANYPEFAAVLASTPFSRWLDDAP